MVEQLRKPVVIISLLIALLSGVILALSAVFILDSLEDDDRETADLVIPSGQSVAGSDSKERDDVLPGSPEFRTVAEASRRAAGGGSIISIERSDDLGETYEVEIMTSRGEVDLALDRDLRQVPNLRYDEQ